MISVSLKACNGNAYILVAMIILRRFQYKRKLDSNKRTDTELHLTEIFGNLLGENKSVNVPVASSFLTQVTPSPVYPDLQVHLNELIVFVHMEFAPQYRPVAHSL